MSHRLLVLFLTVLVLSPMAHAENSDSVIALSTDNDLFAPTQTDRDYTAGLAITYSSNSEDFLGNPVSGISQNLDRFVLSGIGADINEPESAALEFGIYGFTPEEIKARDIDRDDRPTAASFIYRQAIVTGPE